jgi:hypothetical protein
MLAIPVLKSLKKIVALRVHFCQFRASRVIVSARTVPGRRFVDFCVLSASVSFFCMGKRESELLQLASPVARPCRFFRRVFMIGCCEDLQEPRSDMKLNEAQKLRRTKNGSHFSILSA